MVFGVLGVFIFEHLRESVPRVSGLRGTWEAGLQVERKGTTSLRFPARPAEGGAPAPAPKPSLEQDFFSFFFPPPTEIREVFQGTALGGVEGKKSPVAPVCPLPLSRSRRQPNALPDRGAQSGDVYRGAQGEGHTNRTFVFDDGQCAPGTVCRASPHPHKKGPWMEFMPPSCPSSSKFPLP